MPNRFRRARATVAAAALAVLPAAVACSDAPLAPTVAAAESVDPALSVSAPTASANALAAAPTTYTVATCAGGTIALSADEKRSLDLHNQQRAASGLTQFCVDAKLTAAARAHSQEMIDRDYFSHNSYSGQSFSARIVSFGYTRYRALAENIAWGSGSYGDPDRIFTNWMNSAGHRANITNANLREIGIGVAAGTYRTYSGARMYTADFGRR